MTQELKRRLQLETREIDRSCLAQLSRAHRPVAELSLDHVARVDHPQLVVSCVLSNMVEREAYLSPRAFEHL